MVRDWKKCFYCQSGDLSKPTSAPSQAPRFRNNEIGVRACYAKAVDQLLELRNLTKLPSSVIEDDLICNNEPSIIAEEMFKNKAVWHHTCRSSADEQKVKRARVEQKKRHADAESSLASPVKTRRSLANSSCPTTGDGLSSTDLLQTDPCFICSERGEQRWGGCHRAATLGIHEKVWSCAQALQDRVLLAKLSAGDMVAIDAVYHLRCLNRLYKKAASHLNLQKGHGQEKDMLRQQALSELQDFVETFRGSGQPIPMSKIRTLYDKRLAELAIAEEGDVTHTTRLRETIVAAIPDLECVQNPRSRSWDLIFNADLSIAVSEMRKQDNTDKIMILSKAARLLREEILSLRNEFQGTFDAGCEESSVPPALRIFLNMLLDGPKMSLDGDQAEPPELQSPKVALHIGHQLVYNCVKRRSKKGSKAPRHPRIRETPYPLYICIKTYLNTKKAIVDQLHQSGTSVSYDRVRQLATDIANTSIAQWEEKGVVVPNQASIGALTCTGFDNADWNAKSILAKPTSTLHGTFFAVHLPEDQESEVLRACEMGRKSVRDLPDFYTKMDQTIHVSTGEHFTLPALPASHSQSIDLSFPDDMLLTEQRQWMDHSMGLIEMDQLDPTDLVSWGAYFASRSGPPLTPPMRSYPMPLFLEKASDPVTVAHIMKLSQKVTAYLNAGQVPWLETDQPLHFIAKKLQWKYPDQFGEDKMLVTLGGLHIEKMLWLTSGEFHDGSGYSSALVASGVCTPGAADAILKVTNICHTRYVKQVSVMALQILKQRAYAAYRSSAEKSHNTPTPATEDTDDDSGDRDIRDGHSDDVAQLPQVELLGFKEWLHKQCEEQPQAEFWNKCQKLDLLILEVSARYHPIYTFIWCIHLPMI